MFSFRIPDWRMAVAASAALGATALLVACGGGGDGNSTTTTASGSYAQGAITGFGSIFVNGVRFDDSAATVTDDDGNSSSRDALRLGMMVEVEGGLVDRAASSAVAGVVRMGTEVLGPVGTVDTAASTVQVLGQTVLVTTSTVFDSTLSGGLSALAAGAVVEVHGILDTANSRIVATRIESKTAATAYKLRGVVSGLNTTNKSFSINGQLISYAGLSAAQVPVGLADGKIVRVRLQTVQVAGAWVATALRGGVRLPEGTREAEVEGAITVFTSNTSFEIGGLKVDATNASFPEGTTGLALGTRVEVHGTVTNGVMVATRVEIEERRTIEERLLELRGVMGNLDTTAKTFALRGVTVWYGGTVSYRNGTEATLANDKAVEIKGTLSTDRTRIEATRIEFK